MLLLPLEPDDGTLLPADDALTLGDVNVSYQLPANSTLTSITSYSNRKIDITRDAGALTSSITGGSIGEERDDGPRRLRCRRTGPKRTFGPPRARYSAKPPGTRRPLMGWIRPRSEVANSRRHHRADAATKADC